MEDLRDDFKKIVTRFHSRIDFKNLGLDISDIDTRFDNVFLNIDNVADIQYRFDLYRNLIETYQEIKDLILHLNTDCKPNINSFPKHICLGYLTSDDPVDTRHRFYYSALHKDKKENLSQFKMLVIRFWRQLTSYNLNVSRSSQIKITSSRDYEFPLGERAIPYYYDYGKVHKFWNYENTQNRNPRIAHSFHRGCGGSLIQKPNQVWHMDKDFYGIEGHLGKSQYHVLNKLNQMKREQGLAFDIKTVSVGINTGNIDWSDYKCQFKDLETTLKTWQVDFNCLIKGFEQYFGDMPVLVSSTASENTAALFMRKSTATVSYRSTREYMTAEIANGADPCLATERMATEFTVSEKSNPYYPILMGNAKVYGYLFDFVNIKKSWTVFLNDSNYLNQVKSKIEHFCSNRETIYTALEQYANAYQEESGQKGDDWAIFEMLATYGQLKKVCCYISKLDWLKKEIENRKKEILQKLTLCEVVKKHPGAEHIQGVYKGGTLLLVYAGETENQDNPFGLDSQAIVADFALPYMCCSDCAPTQVVYANAIEEEDPEPEVTIYLDEKEFCENDTKYYSFTISPENTNVKITGKGVTIDNCFIPSTAGIGEHTFKINDKDAKFKVIVQKNEIPDFDIVYKKNGTAYFEITTNPDLKDFDKEWKINEETVGKIEGKKIDLKRYKEDVSISVIVKKNKCKKYKEITLNKVNSENDLKDWHNNAIDRLKSMEQDSNSNYIDIITISGELIKYPSNIDLANKINEEWDPFKWAKLEEENYSKDDYIKSHEIMLANYVIAMSTMEEEDLKKTKFKTNKLTGRNQLYLDYYNKEMNKYFSDDFKKIVNEIKPKSEFIAKRLKQLKKTIKS